MEVTPDQMASFLKPRPKVLHKDIQQLEFEETEIRNEVMEVSNGVKVRVRVVDQEIKQRVTIVREFNPELNYEDGISEIITEE